MEIQDVACNAVLYSQLFGFFFFVRQWSHSGVLFAAAILVLF